MSQNPEMPLPVTSAPTVTTCVNCHSVMPAELRFCRNCGFRLGEGVAEYTETIRFDGSNIPVGPQVASVPRKRRRKISGMTWIFVGLLAFFVCAAAFTAIVTPFRPRVQISSPAAPRSYVGVNSFESTEGNVGATFDSVDTPGGPADKAGLVGGDIITAFDGRGITEDDQLMDLLRQTPIGKTVDITYIRDGQIKKTKLTTISREEMDRLNRDFRNRPEGAGVFGYEDGDAERVEVPLTPEIATDITSGTTASTSETKPRSTTDTPPRATADTPPRPPSDTPRSTSDTPPRPPSDAPPVTAPKSIYGVKLNTVYRSRPADLAGIKEGDVIIQFGDIPIRTPREFRMRVSRAIPYSTVNVIVVREGQRIEIPVKMGKQ